MSWTQTWIIDGKLIAQAPCPQEHSHAELHPPESLGYFCPQCGELWARRIINPSTRWHVLTRECPKHQAPRYCEPGGSVWRNLNPGFLQNLPKAVLKRETLLRLEQDK
jgi:hypothetical protein